MKTRKPPVPPKGGQPQLGPVEGQQIAFELHSSSPRKLSASDHGGMLGPFRPRSPRPAEVYNAAMAELTEGDGRGLTKIKTTTGISPVSSPSRRRTFSSVTPLSPAGTSILDHNSLSLRATMAMTAGGAACSPSAMLATNSARHLFSVHEEQRLVSPTEGYPAGGSLPNTPPRKATSAPDSQLAAVQLRSSLNPWRTGNAALDSLSPLSILHQHHQQHYQQALQQHQQQQQGPHGGISPRDYSSEGLGAAAAAGAGGLGSAAGATPAGAAAHSTQTITPIVQPSVTTAALMTGGPFGSSQQQQQQGGSPGGGPWGGAASVGVGPGAGMGMGVGAGGGRQRRDSASSTDSHSPGVYDSPLGVASPASLRITALASRIGSPSNSPSTPSASSQPHTPTGLRPRPPGEAPTSARSRKFSHLASPEARQQYPLAATGTAAGSTGGTSNGGGGTSAVRQLSLVDDPPPPPPIRTLLRSASVGGGGGATAGGMNSSVVPPSSSSSILNSTMPSSFSTTATRANTAATSAGGSASGAAGGAGGYSHPGTPSSPSTSAASAFAAAAAVGGSGGGAAAGGGSLPGSRPSSSRAGSARLTCRPVAALVDAVRSRDDAKLAEVLEALKGPQGVVLGLNDLHHVTGRTPLHEAVMSNNISMVALLLAAGAEANKGHQTQGPPLLHCAAFGEVETMQLLLTEGADVNAADIENSTALHFACKGGHVDAARLLIKFGADLRARDSDGMAPFDLAAPEMSRLVMAAAPPPSPPPPRPPLSSGGGGGAGPRRLSAGSHVAAMAAAAAAAAAGTATACSEQHTSSASSRQSSASTSSTARAFSAAVTALEADSSTASGSSGTDSQKRLGSAGSGSGSGANSTLSGRPPSGSSPTALVASLCSPTGVQLELASSTASFAATTAAAPSGGSGGGGASSSMRPAPPPEPQLGGAGSSGGAGGGGGLRSRRNSGTFTAAAVAAAQAAAAAPQPPPPPSLPPPPPPPPPSAAPSGLAIGSSPLHRPGTTEGSAVGVGAAGTPGNRNLASPLLSDSEAAPPPSPPTLQLPGGVRRQLSRGAVLGDIISAFQAEDAEMVRRSQVLPSAAGVDGPLRAAAANGAAAVPSIISDLGSGSQPSSQQQQQQQSQQPQQESCPQPDVPFGVSTTTAQQAIDEERQQQQQQTAQTAAPAVAAVAAAAADVGWKPPCGFMPPAGCLGGAGAGLGFKFGISSSSDADCSGESVTPQMGQQPQQQQRQQPPPPQQLLPFSMPETAIIRFGIRLQVHGDADNDEEGEGSGGKKPPSADTDTTEAGASDVAARPPSFSAAAGVPATPSPLWPPPAAATAAGARLPPPPPPAAAASSNAPVGFTPVPATGFKPPRASNTGGGGGGASGTTSGGGLPPPYRLSGFGDDSGVPPPPPLMRDSSPVRDRASSSGAAGGGGGSSTAKKATGPGGGSVAVSSRHAPTRTSQLAAAALKRMSVMKASVDDAIEMRAAAMFRQSTELTTGEMAWTRGELLGEGAYGKVYAGLNQQTGELMAVKVLTLLSKHGDKKAIMSQLEALEHEMSLYKKLKHKHVVGYIDAKYDASTSAFYIFLEYVPGGSIASMLSRFKRFSEELVRHYTRQLLSGLEYLHGCKIVHRDLKGANVLVTRDGVVKLADFGASKAYRDHTITDCMKSVRGSVFWMAPEVIRGTGYGRRADIWSLGCTVIEMLTGAHPWPHLDNQWTAMFTIARCEEGPPRPANMSPEAARFLDRCLQFDPAKRPTAAELLQDPFVARTGAGGAAGG
ncbi:hypothetical protein Agub_g11479, partial [Astrephomene gubernaculifera]